MATLETDPFSIDGPHHADIEFVHISVAPIENAPTSHGTFRVHGSVGIRDYRIHRNLPRGNTRTYLISPTQLFIREETDGCYGLPGTFAGSANQDVSVKEVVKQVDRLGSATKAGGKADIMARLSKANLNASVSASGQRTSSSERVHSVESSGRPALYGRVAAGWIIGRRHGDGLHDSYMDDRHWAEYKFMPTTTQAKLAYNVILQLENLNIQAEGPKTTPRIGFRKTQNADDGKHVRNRLKELVASMVARFQISSLMETKGYRDGKDDVVLARVEITANMHDVPGFDSSHRDEPASLAALKPHTNRKVRMK